MPRTVAESFAGVGNPHAIASMPSGATVADIGCGAGTDLLLAALRRLGKEVTYVRYEGEEHWQGTWGRANVVDCWNRVIDWFDQHLSPHNGGSQKH